MKLKDYLIVAALFSATLLPIGYKTFVLGLDFFPTLKEETWELEFQLKIKPAEKERRVFFAVPAASERLKVLKTQFEGKHVALTIDQTLEGNFAHVTGVIPRTTEVFYRLHLQPQAQQYKIPKQDTTQSYRKKVARFLEPIPLEPALEEKVAQLEQELFPDKVDKVKKIKRLYYFVHEEILKSKKTLGVEEAILQSKGASHDKADLFTILARRQHVPARTVRGLWLIERDDPRRPLVYWNEVYLGKQWIPVFTTQGYWGEISAEFVPLYTSIGLEPKEQTTNGVKEVIRAQRLTAESFSTIQYRQELYQKNSPFLSFSPYMLPLKEQSGFKLLLLFAFGTLVLAFCRNVIGIKSFGVFFPILLAIFFKATSLWFGLGFFAVIILLGLSERRLLQSLRLMAVPRFAIVLTVLVITLLLFAIFNNQYHFSKYNPAILPIIITTMFIERFSIMWEEEGMWNTVLTLLGTLFIALLGYVLFLWQGIARVLYTHPETLFSVIALLILIGRYTGYRLSELFRFRELLKHSDFTHQQKNNQ